MGVIRKKEIVAMANLDILKLIYYHGDGVMAQQHMIKYMKLIFSWSEYRTKTELRELLEYGILERTQLHRLVFYRLSRFGKGIVLSKKKTTEFSAVSKEPSLRVRSLVLNHFAFSMFSEEKFKSDTIEEFLMKFQVKTTMFYRQKKAYLILKQYYKEGNLELAPYFGDEWRYLGDAKNAVYKIHRGEEKAERPAIFNELVTYHGLQDMNIHSRGFVGNNGVMTGFNFLFFQLNVRMTAPEVFEKVERASLYLKLLLTVTGRDEMELQFHVVCNDEDTLQRFQRYYEKHKQELNNVSVVFTTLDIDVIYFGGNRVLLNV